MGWRARGRGRWPEEDDAGAAELVASPKERAENLMIVDLLRNDAGRIAEFGTVRVPRLFDVERYPDISVVVTALQPTTGNTAELRASFTIKGNTEPVPLPVNITELDDGSVRISGETKVERAQFGLGWNKLGVMSPTATIAADVVFVRATQ